MGRNNETDASFRALRLIAIGTEDKPTFRSRAIDWPKPSPQILRATGNQRTKKKITIPLPTGLAVEAEFSVRRRPKPRLRLPGLRGPLHGVPRRCLQAVTFSTNFEDPLREAAGVVGSCCALSRRMLQAVMGARRGCLRTFCSECANERFGCDCRFFARLPHPKCCMRMCKRCRRQPALASNEN